MSEVFPASFSPIITFNPSSSSEAYLTHRVTEKYAEYVSLLNANFESEKMIADSLYAQCLTLHDSLSDGRNVPDSCRIGLDVEKSVSSLQYAYDAILESFNAYYDSLTALSNDSSLDDSIKTCANAFITYGNMAKDSLRPFVSLSGMMQLCVSLVCRMSSCFFFAVAERLTTNMAISSMYLEFFIIILKLFLLFISKSSGKSEKMAIPLDC